MGKIRVKTLGSETEEAAQKEKQREIRLAKKAAQKAQNTKNADSEPASTQTSEDTTSAAEQGKSAKKAVKKDASKRFKENENLISKSTMYPLDKAIDMLKKLKKAKFDETVELHINVKEKGVNGQVLLPHGTGKRLNVKIADDKLIAQIETGKIDFDVLLASPSIMPKLAKVARVLGPRGLMPNPKNGTITEKPEEMIEKLTKGQISYKTEAKAPLMHVTVGKVSFEPKALKENISTLLASIGEGKITAITLKSTMSPAVKVDTTKLV